MIKDKAELRDFNDVKFPKIHGHVKIKTAYAKSGNVAQIVEGDNIITNAVADILKANYLNGIDFGALSGSNGLWKTWFGGILAFEQFHPTVDDALDPDDYFPPIESTNSLKAHAGQTSIDTEHDDDFTRGNPLTSSNVQTEKSIKQVFEWGTTHGNGNIRSLSLCHSDLGSYGLGNSGYAFRNSFNPFAIINTQSSKWVANGSYSTGIISANSPQVQYDESHCLSFVLGEDGQYKSGNARFSTPKMTIYLANLPFTKTGLFNSMDAVRTNQRKFTVTTPITWYGFPSYHFDYTTKKLWLFSNITDFARASSGWHNGEIEYCVIDCSAEDYDSSETYNTGDVCIYDGIEYKCTANNVTGGWDSTKWTDSATVDSGTITPDVADIAPLYMYDSQSGTYAYIKYNNLIKDGNYVYFPRSTSPTFADHSISRPNIIGYRKVKITDGTSTKIDFDSMQSLYRCTMKAGDFLVTGGRVVNGMTGHTCVDMFPSDNGCFNYNFANPYGVSTYATPQCAYNYWSINYYPRYVLAHKLLLTTKYNLPSVVEKTANQNMIIEYTLEEE